MRFCLVCCELTIDEDCICPECQAYVIAEADTVEEDPFYPCCRCERPIWLCECLSHCVLCGMDQDDCKCEPFF